MTLLQVSVQIVSGHDKMDAGKLPAKAGPWVQPRTPTECLTLVSLDMFQLVRRCSASHWPQLCAALP